MAEAPHPPADPPVEPNRPEPPPTAGSVLEEPSEDERGIGWSEPDQGGGDRDDDWYLRERPPHHG